MSARGESGRSCATLAMVSPAGARYSPASVAISPRINASSVDLPQPLRPTMPTFSPRNSVTVASSSSTCGPRRMRAFDRVNKSQSGRAGGRLVGIAQQVRKRDRAAGLRGVQRPQILGGARLTEQAPLTARADPSQQLPQLAPRLDPLGNHFHTEAASHLDDGAHDGGIAGIIGGIADE